MRKTFLAMFAALILVTAAHAAPAKDGWPDTPAGSMGRRWVAAFSAGDSAMLAFHARELTPEAKAKRTDKERLSTYRSLHEKYGTLSLGKVVNSKPEELTVKLLDSDAKSHEFVFKVVAGSPTKLSSVSVKQSHFGHGGGHGGGGHGE